MTQINRPLNFDTGIEQIVVQNGTRPAMLPAESRILPGDAQITHLLDEVLSPRSVEQDLVESLRPDISHREILTPPGYEAARDAAGPALEAALSQIPDS